MQCALRLGRSEAEGCPKLRVLRISRSDGALASRPKNECARAHEPAASPHRRTIAPAEPPPPPRIRPVRRYDAVIGGPKTRARLGSVASADWTALLGDFGVVRQSDPSDWRCLVDVAPAPAFVPSPREQPTAPAEPTE